MRENKQQLISSFHRLPRDFQSNKTLHNNLESKCHNKQRPKFPITNSKHIIQNKQSFLLI